MGAKICWEYQTLTLCPQKDLCQVWNSSFWDRERNGGSIREAGRIQVLIT